MADASNISERPSSKAREEIIREAQRLEESTLYSFKGHHCAASTWRYRHLWLGIPTVVLSTIVGATAFSKFSEAYPWVAVVAGLLSISVAVLSAITTFLNPNDKENAHFNAAHGYDKLNNDCRMFWSIECWTEEATDVLESRLKTLVGQKNELNSSSPQIPDWAYRKAKTGIADGEASFQVDKPRPQKTDDAPAKLPLNQSDSTSAIASPKTDVVVADAVPLENSDGAGKRTG